MSTTATPPDQPQPTSPARRGDPIGAAVAFVILVGLGGTALWIAITNQPVSGGLPGLPPAWNQLLGRVMIGAGGVMCAWLAVLAAREVRGAFRTAHATIATTPESRSPDSPQ